MASTDIRAMQTAFTEAFREAQVAGMTSAERWTLMQSKLLKYADDPDTWQFIDRAGRKWKRNNYFDMVNRTVSANVARDAYNDTLIDEGRDLVQIIGPQSENTRDACLRAPQGWVGRVVSLTGNTQGFPKLSSYIADGGFGPNCQHTTVYVSDKVEKGIELIDDQRGQAKPKVKQSRSNPVVKMKSTNSPR
jgi:hypothetical protein